MFPHSPTERLLKAAVTRFRRRRARGLARLLRENADLKPAFPETVEWKQTSGPDISREFVYKDETWNPVKHIGAYGILGWWGHDALPYDDNACDNTRVTFSGNRIRFESRENQANRWMVLRLADKPGSVHAIEFIIRIESPFTEIQYAFQFRTIMQRLRFMINDNSELIFQCLRNGSFIPPIASRPLSLFPGKPHHIRIEVVQDHFRYRIDGETVLELALPGFRGDAGDDAALILFEAGPHRPVLAELSEVRLFSGILKEAPSPSDMPAKPQSF